MDSFPPNLSSSDENQLLATGQRILIVDDEPAILFAYRRLIEREGMIVDISASLQEAVNLLLLRPYLAVIADMRLAGSDNADGLEILRLIRQERLATKVILATGYGSQAVEQEALALGASHYFQKPVLPATILSALKEMHALAVMTGAVE